MISENIPLQAILCAGLYPNVTASEHGIVGAILSTFNQSSNTVNSGRTVWFDGRREGNWDPSKSNCGTLELKAARQFSFKELKKCTDNFSLANDVGSGGYGKTTDSHKTSSKGIEAGRVEFKAEIELLSRVHHKNVIMAKIMSPLNLKIIAQESGANRPPMSDVVKEIEIILHSIGLDPAAESGPSTSSSFQHNEFLSSFVNSWSRPRDLSDLEFWIPWNCQYICTPLVPRETTRSPKYSGDESFNEDVHQGTGDQRWEEPQTLDQPPWQQPPPMHYEEEPFYDAYQSTSYGEFPCDFQELPPYAYETYPQHSHTSYSQASYHHSPPYDHNLYTPYQPPLELHVEQPPSQYQYSQEPQIPHTPP
ncbi:putative leucine-rich repeat receptor-like protein kinase [Arachis hypogaea]|nr:putative leucine-rich repeat receptor-like protein kinase [Arachis hypogaea]